MAEITDRPAIAHHAVAEAEVEMAQATLSAIVDGTTGKGDVLSVAELAGVIAGKRTAELIPLVHPAGLTQLLVSAAPRSSRRRGQDPGGDGGHRPGRRRDGGPDRRGRGRPDGLRHGPGDGAGGCRPVGQARLELGRGRRGVATAERAAGGRAAAEGRQGGGADHSDRSTGRSAVRARAA